LIGRAAIVGRGGTLSPGIWQFLRHPQRRRRNLQTGATGAADESAP
jgi:hypothetical protein